ncbi:MAG: hypothetical protein FJY91_02215 [Candidatus Harrisonbacteria bacterium]|nr:hypothetical protein [Candidatus Harrisonbacteria bacterium]
MREIQWFLFALVLAGIFGLLIYKEQPSLPADLKNVVTDIQSPETPKDLYDYELGGGADGTSSQ